MKELTALEVEQVVGGTSGPGPDDDPNHFARKGSGGPFPEDSGPLPSPWDDVIPPSALEQPTASPPPDPESDPQGSD